MDGLGYAGAVLLAALFVRAGAAKLARPAATTASFVALGVPAAATTARAVPVVELAVAVALLTVPRAGAVAALGLLVPFTAVLARAVAAGTQAPCNCFGAAGADPVSSVDVARNVLLAALAVAAATAPRPELPSAVASVVVIAAFGTGAGLLRAARRYRRAAAG
jgi:uncharacterized membrane protein YphA (DoxX/SURF4 family)